MSSRAVFAHVPRVRTACFDRREDSTMRSRFAGALSIALAMMLSPVACSDGPTGLAGDDAQMVLTASVVGTPIATLVVEVSAPDITVPIVYNLTVLNGVATGTLKMPPGEDRLITVRAFDSFGEIT